MPMHGSPGRTIHSGSAHEACAQAIPETWVVESAEGKYVGGIENIVKDRWTLVSGPTGTGHGAKIQCAKGKCSKAFQVSCAKDTADIEVTVTEGQSDLVIPDGELRAGEHVKKQTVTALCPQHNPQVVEARKLDRQAKLGADIGALTQYSRIKVRASGGVFTVTLVNVYEDRRTVEVIWDQGGTKEFRYSSVVWSDQPDGAVQEKPTVTAPSTQFPFSSLVHTWTSGSTSLAKSSGSYNQLPSSSSQPLGPGYPFPEYLQNAYPHLSYQYPPHLRPFPSHSQPIPATGQPHPANSYPASMAVPMQYSYPYGYYDQAYSSQPHFYPAHGYYQPVMTFHAATLPSARVKVVSETDASATQLSDKLADKAAASSSQATSTSIWLSLASYVGVRPASSQDILNGYTNLEILILPYQLRLRRNLSDCLMC
ncbi:hypothetical protein FRC12_003708 [Ceratobasidium sp. 428]|nr:hypothetical protein FRC12_003708 [Ceratobasidium sp. 428]